MRRPGHAIGLGSSEDEAAVTSGEDAFLKIAAVSRFDLLKAMILPSQAIGFDPKAFIEDRFRMKSADFSVAGWDINSIGVTAARRSGDVLTSCVVMVKVPDSDQPKPVVVNLTWRKQAQRWYLVPYPEAE